VLFCLVNTFALLPNHATIADVSKVEKLTSFLNNPTHFPGSYLGGAFALVVIVRRATSDCIAGRMDVPAKSAEQFPSSARRLYRKPPLCVLC
jgi:hypothetical protein